MLITSICLTFSSCTKADDKISKTTSNSDYSLSTETQTTENKIEQKKNVLEYNKKQVKDITLELLDSKTSLGTANAKDLLDIESSAKPVDVNLNMQIGRIIIVFTDDSEYEFGKIFTGRNNHYYLQIENKDKTNIYELNDKIAN